MFKRTTKKPSLRAQLAKALQSDRLDEALDLYEQIEKQTPDEPRWAHRKGDLLQRVGRKPEAVVAYERAVELEMNPIVSHGGPGEPLRERTAPPAVAASRAWQ